MTDAGLSDGILTVNLRREIPEAMKPKTIEIASTAGNLLEGEKEISEDDERKAETDIQQITDSFVNEVDQKVAEKEKEVMEV